MHEELFNFLHNLMAVDSPPYVRLSSETFEEEKGKSWSFNFSPSLSHERKVANLLSRLCLPVGGALLQQKLKKNDEKY